MILKFAWRYFRGKKSTQAIQIISWVSVVAMAVGTAALILVLSVFNGFESFIKDLYSNFYPDIKITSVVGNDFELQEPVFREIEKIKGIQFISKTLEQKALLTFEENQSVVTLKGVDANYDSVTQVVDDLQQEMSDMDSMQTLPLIALGLGVSNNLGADEETHFPINCYIFKKDANISLDPTQIYNTQPFVISALFKIQDEIDNEYAFTSLITLQELSEKYNAISSLEIKLVNDADEKETIKQLSKILGPHHLKAETRYEQNKTLFFILKSEGWAVYAILTMMLLIASFNIIGSLSMLVIEKEKDIAILKTMGMQNMGIRKIFIATGILISMTGALIGCVLAAIICFVQIQFGFVKWGDGDEFVATALPVKLNPLDFVLALGTVVVIAIIASWIPAVKASKKEIELRVR